MLAISNLSFSIQGKPLFDEASATIPAGHKVGLVGRNGTGKTSLFRLIRGEWALDSGTIEVPSYFRIGGVDQEAPASDDSLIDTVLAADTERAALMQEAESALDPDRIAEVYQRLADIDAHSAEARASTILSGLGFDQAAQARPCHEFSGGWRMRVALGAVLFAQPDLLLLDEPTNYLDLEGAVWLENFLAKYSKTVLVISHDRELLNRSVTGILHLSDRKLGFYTGNYDQFDSERRAKLEQHMAMKTKQDQQRAHIQSFVDRFRAKATKARQAQSRIKQLERMQPIAALTESAVASFKFPTPNELAPPLITIENGSVGYGGVPVLRELNLRLDQDDRIALLGANGEGKSTLSKLLADRLPLMQGQLNKSSKLKVGFFAQHQLDELVEGDNAYNHIVRHCPGEPISKVRARLGAAGFGADLVDVPVEKLSGGQKARLLMLMATIDAPHIMILDEPTNHLDIESRESLVLALNDYGGAVILVSHDSHLVEMVADRLWLVRGGHVVDYQGDMNDYKRQLLSERSGRGGKKEAKSKGKSPGPEPKKHASPSTLRAAIKESEKAIQKLTKAKEKLEASMAEPDFYQTRPASAIEQAGRELAKTTSRLASEEEKWLLAQAQLEEAAGA